MLVMPLTTHYKQRSAERLTISHTAKEGFIFYDSRISTVVFTNP
jgi:hypothetical protein